jgi:regulatory protein
MKKNDPDSLADAENSAAHLIKFRMRAEKELKYRLREKGYNENIIDELILKLKKMGIIDDNKFAYLYMYDKVTLNKKGVIAVSNDLLKLGVEKHIVDETAQKIKNEVNMYDIAKEQAEKYLSTKNDFLKLRKYLFRRGFDTEIIEYVIKDLGGEADDY